MKNFDRAWSLSQVATYLQGRLAGDPEEIVLGIASPEEAAPNYLCVVWEKKWLQKLGEKVFVIAPVNWLSPGQSGVEIEDPKKALIKLLSLFERPRSSQRGVHPSAVVHERASVDPSAYVGPLCVVDEGAVISANAILEAHVYVGKNVFIGEGTVIEPNASIYHNVTLKKRCLIHAGASLGCEGFGFYNDKEGLIKIPQVGGLFVEDDVEIGALTSIDRGTIGDTHIGSGTKIGDCVHIGHNAKIGSNCIIVAMTGIAGSAVIEDNVIMAAQSGVKDHVKVGRGTIVAAKSGVTKDIPPGMMVSGFPARDHREELKIQALMQKLPEIYERLVHLERELGAKDRDGKKNDPSKNNRS